MRETAKERVQSNFEPPCLTKNLESMPANRNGSDLVLRDRAYLLRCLVIRDVGFDPERPVHMEIVFVQLK